MKPPINRRQLVQTAAVGLLPFGAQAAPAKSTGWTIYGGDQEATHYSPLSQITSDNVSKLRVAWVHRAPPEAAETGARWSAPR